MPAPTTSPRPSANPRNAASARADRRARDAAFENHETRRDDNPTAAQPPKSTGFGTGFFTNLVNKVSNSITMGKADSGIAKTTTPPSASNPDGQGGGPGTKSPITKPGTGTGGNAARPVTLPVDPVQPDRGQRRPNAVADADMAMRNQGAGRGSSSYRGSVLSSVYRLPNDGTRAVRTLQAFNGKQNERLSLGR